MHKDDSLHHEGRDASIIRCLQLDPRAAAREIAKSTRIPESTVQKRLRFLHDRGTLTYHLTLAADNRFFPARAMISINIDPPKLEDPLFGYYSQQDFVYFLHYEMMGIAEFTEFTRNIILERVEIVLGGHSDIVMFVSATNINALGDFVTRVLRKLRGVSTTNTAMVISYPKSLKGSSGSKAKIKR